MGFKKGGSNTISMSSVERKMTANVKTGMGSQENHRTLVIEEDSSAAVGRVDFNLASGGLVSFIFPPFASD